MNERQRQAWLKAFELTPWVATRQLPGAAVSPALDWPEQESDVMEAAEAPVAAAPAPSAPVAERPQVDLAALKQAEAPRAVQPPTPKSAPAPAAGTGLRVTIQAHQAGRVWVLAEQDDPGAPDLGREPLRLLHNILKLFPGGGGQRKFVWPLGGLAQDDAAAAPAFRSFVEALGSGRDPARVLLCASEPVVQALTGGERFSPVRDGDTLLLAVASLDEMLAEPVNAKRRTWQAMVRAGLHA